MGALYGAFAYPNSDASRVLDQLFTSLHDSAVLTEVVSQRKIGLRSNEQINFSVEAPSLDSIVSITPEDVPCLVLRRDVTGANWDESEGRDAYVDLLIALYEHLPKTPSLAYAMDLNQGMGVTDGTEPAPIDGDNLDHEGFYTSAWVMFFQPRHVEQYGREAVLDLPTRRIDELDDGTIVTVAEGDPALGTAHHEIAEALDLPFQKFS